MGYASLIMEEPEESFPESDPEPLVADARPLHHLKKFQVFVLVAATLACVALATFVESPWSKASSAVSPQSFMDKQATLPQGPVNIENVNAEGMYLNVNG